MAELVVALVVSLAAAPLVRRVLVASDVLDVPNARSSHESPVARGGGIACAFGVTAALAVGQVRGDDVPWGVFVAVAALCVLGLADDLTTLPAVPRLVVQAACGALMGWLAGRSVAAVVVGVVVVVLAVNVTNFMDGINGISGLTATVWGVAAAAAGWHASSDALLVIGLATAGAALGFLPFNVPVARLFLGDSGSYLLGALVAAGVLIAWRDGVGLALVVAPMAVYLLDVLMTLVRRAARREPLMQAHRDHVYQQLVPLLGGSHLRVTAVVVAAAVLVAVAAWLPWAVAAPVVLVVLAVYLASPSWLRGRSEKPTTVGVRDA